MAKMLIAKEIAKLETEDDIINALFDIAYGVKSLEKNATAYGMTCLEKMDENIEMPKAPYMDKHGQGLVAFAKKILECASEEKIAELFEEAFTAKQIETIDRRFVVAYCLWMNMTYKEVAAKTGGSSSMISDVNKFLVYGADGLARMVMQMKTTPAQIIKSYKDIYGEKSSKKSADASKKKSETQYNNMSEIEKYCANHFERSDVSKQIKKADLHIAIPAKGQSTVKYKETDELVPAFVLRCALAQYIKQGEEDAFSPCEEADYIISKFDEKSFYEEIIKKYGYFGHQTREEYMSLLFAWNDGTPGNIYRYAADEMFWMHEKRTAKLVFLLCRYATRQEIQCLDIRSKYWARIPNYGVKAYQKYLEARKISPCLKEQIQFNASDVDNAQREDYLRSLIEKNTEMLYDADFDGVYSSPVASGGSISCSKNGPDKEGLEFTYAFLDSLGDSYNYREALDELVAGHWLSCDMRPYEVIKIAIAYKILADPESTCEIDFAADRHDALGDYSDYGDNAEKEFWKYIRFELNEEWPEGYISVWDKNE